MASPILNELIAIVVFICFGLALFIYVLCQQKKLTHYWIMLHGLAVITNLVAILSTIANMFVLGRTESECLLLHRIGGTAFAAVQGMMRIYFSGRVTMLNKMESRISQGIDYFVLFLSCLTVPVGAIYLNLVMTTIVIPFIELCVYLPSDQLQYLTTVSRLIIDISINVRFFKYVMTRHSAAPSVKTTTTAGFRDTKPKATSSQNTSGHNRLINITIGFFLIQTIFELFTTFMVKGMTPITIDQYVLVFIYEMACNAASTIWPMILVHFLKKTTTLSSLRVPIVRNI
uniref:Uncharacterized protein n=1 Tax=Spongospora subterranea TaxID=70186 RepID=A0A0H5QT17_9EUKA|eukprot:CRZ04827.1 hypothetical protein [Spongospora subterranea]